MKIAQEYRLQQREKLDYIQCAIGINWQAMVSQLFSSKKLCATIQNNQNYFSSICWFGFIYLFCEIKVRYKKVFIK